MNSNNPFSSLNSALSGKGGTIQKGYRHEREDKILDQLFFVMKHSEKAKELLAFASDNKLEIHVLKNKEDFGYMPEGKVVYIAGAPHEHLGTPEMLINLVGALREAQQETLPELKRPGIETGEEAYVNKQMDRKADVYWHQCKVIEDIESALGFTEIIDSFRQMGYSEILDAYRKDKESAS